MGEFATRFAPSPSGLLHLGHAFSALTAFAAAQAAGGRFLLRLEDIDSTRCKDEYTNAIIDDLHWLGLEWEQPVRVQSAHMDEYAAALARLRDLGVLYRCFRTRREVMAESLRAPHGPELVYHGPKEPVSQDQEAELLASGKPFAWRLNWRAARDHLGQDWQRLGFVELGNGPGGEHGKIAAQPQNLGDVVLARKDIATSYHLAVSHDDAAQGISHVVRGQDLFESTHVHVLLQALLGLPTPFYHHHRLMHDARGQRLATRDQVASLLSLRQKGTSAADLRRQLMDAKG